MDIIENIQTEVMNMDISERLQELRKKEGYSQEQVAEMLGEIDNIIKLTEIYHVSADYILLGTEKVSVPVPEKKELSHEYKKAIGIIAIIAATAIVTVLFITALGFLSRLGI